MSSSGRLCTCFVSCSQADPQSKRRRGGGRGQPFNNLSRNLFLTLSPDTVHFLTAPTKRKRSRVVHCESWSRFVTGPLVVNSESQRNPTRDLRPKVTGRRRTKKLRLRSSKADTRIRRALIGFKQKETGILRENPELLFHESANHQSLEEKNRVAGNGG